MQVLLLIGPRGFLPLPHSAPSVSPLASELLLNSGSSASRPRASRFSCVAGMSPDERKASSVFLVAARRPGEAAPRSISPALKSRVLRCVSFCLLFRTSASSRIKGSNTMS